jgi:centrosomal protein CEP164
MNCTESKPPLDGADDFVILEEEIDPNFVPSESEVAAYAKWLGMDMDKDQDLFWIAREGVLAPLPKDWRPCRTKDTEDIYYFNFNSGESTWDHPCDSKYQRMYEEEKNKKEAAIKVGFGTEFAMVNESLL